METTATPPRGLVARFSGYAANALRYWEPRRLAYNGALALVVLLHFAADWPGSKGALTFDLALGVFFLSVLANLAYSVAYAPDLFLQFSGLDSALRWGRPILLAVGIAFAATITHFFASNLFKNP